MAVEDITRKTDIRETAGRQTRGSDGIAAPQTSSACIVMITGTDLGRRWKLDSSAVIIGRDEQCDVAVDIDRLSRRHCEIRFESDGLHVCEDLRSTNGTFVNSEPISGPRILRSGDFLQAGDAVFKYLDGDQVEALFHEEIYRISIVDGLTQVHNKRYLMEYLARELLRCQRFGRPLSLMLMDIDHFKQINDTYGHVAGDYVLRELASMMNARVRKVECFARFGGEEFAVVMPEVEQEKACVFAEKLRAMVEARELTFDGKPIRVTVSIGVVQMTAKTLEVPAFLEAADARLYDAKRTGRNRVVT